MTTNPGNPYQVEAVLEALQRVERVVAVVADTEPVRARAGLAGSDAGGLRVVDGDQHQR